MLSDCDVAGGCRRGGDQADVGVDVDAATRRDIERVRREQPVGAVGHDTARCCHQRDMLCPEDRAVHRDGIPGFNHQVATVEQSGGDGQCIGLPHGEILVGAG